MLVTGASDNSIGLYSINLYNEENNNNDNKDPLVLQSRIKAAHEEDINCVIWNKNSNVFASSSDDTTIKIWTVTEFLEAEEFKEDIDTKLEDKELVEKLKTLETSVPTVDNIVDNVDNTSSNNNKDESENFEDAKETYKDNN